VIEFVAPSGRAVNSADSFACAWVTPTRARLRLDGVAGILQDVATTTGRRLVSNRRHLVVRRTTIRVADGGRWPRYTEVLTSRRGAAAWSAWPNVERTSPHAWTLNRSGRLVVPVDPSAIRSNQAGVLRRLRRSNAGKKGISRVRRRSADGASTLAWPLRRADLDVVGHVNTPPLAGRDRSRDDTVSW